MNLETFRKETRILVYCLLAAGAGAAVASHSWAQHPPAVAPVAAAAAAPVTPGTIETSFAPVVEKALPAIVNIASSKASKVSQLEMPEMDPFFRQFFGREFDGQQFGGRNFGRGNRGNNQPQRRLEHSLGSGVIVRSDGYILTNNHVIDGATDITVTLNDKRELKAKVVGGDSMTDIAVLKVDASSLAALPLADSAKGHVGDLVLAMGNPFGLGQTVTMGIISAQGRANLGIEDYEDFIQTDAAINPGNSGGALINTRGELIGINTAILSGGGGNQGVGFAVPVNLARNVMTQVMEHGKVVRGYLGVLPQDVTPAMAKGFNLKQSGGVLIGDVTAGTPAAQAGIERGDVILEVDGQKVEDSNQLKLRISQMSPGTSVKLRVLHDGSERTVTAKLAEMPANLGRGGAAEKSSDSGTSSALDGVSVEAVDAQTLGQLKLPAATRGVVVTDIAEGSPAAQAGLRQGDVIQEVNRGRVSSVADFDRAVRNASGGTTLLLVNRGGYTMYLAIQVR
jgi:serine protease Do